jgi:hypothetical protein
MSHARWADKLLINPAAYFPEGKQRGLADAARAGDRDCCRMHKRYAVVFCERGRAVSAGGLELREDRLLLSGGSGQERCDLSVQFCDLAEIRIGRGRADRLNGYPTLVLERGQMPAVQLAPLGAGLLHEIADLLLAISAERRAGGTELAVVVPLKPNCLLRAAKLLEAGPPVDPAALGLSSHQVYLREGEAVFVFRGPEVSARVGKAMRSPALWRAGLAWQDCIAGRPRIHRSTEMLSREATPAYSWAPPENPGSV